MSMDKKTYFYIDDVIWAFRDLTRQRPASLFGTPFMKMLKTAHERYGLKVQLNIFWRTDFFYGNDEFTLADMTDAYKAEWEEASDWLKLGFHSKQEFPDYPYLNADYSDVADLLRDVKKEVYRFAGEKSFAHATVTHWLPMSKEGCQALYDGGIRIMSVSTGVRTEYNGDPSSLPYGHSFRLLQNRKPESGIFGRGIRNEAIEVSLCGYNHLTDDKIEPIKYKLDSWLDEEIGIRFKKFCVGPILNLSTMESIPEELAPILDSEYLGYATHEQYFYEDYYAYQPDYAEKLYKAAEIITENGYTYFFAEELAK